MQTFPTFADTHAMKIPKIYHFGSLSSKGSFIVMEYLKFGGSYSQADLGQALAEMHKAEPAVSLGKLLQFVLHATPDLLTFPVCFMF